MARRPPAWLQPPGWWRGVGQRVLPCKLSARGFSFRQGGACRSSLRSAGVSCPPDQVPEEWSSLAQLHDPDLWEEDGFKLGKGAFGTVARGVNKQTGELVAIKRIQPSHPLSTMTARNEVEAAELLGTHPNIVQMKGHFLREVAGAGEGAPRCEMVLVYRLALGGSLQEWIMRVHGTSFSVDYARPTLTDESLRIMRDLTTGLMHFHSKNVQHRDLKPANILLSAGGTAVIADFGIALVNRTSTRVQGHSALGDFYFIDVDSLVTEGLGYTLDDDIYSMAEVFVRILYGSYARGTELRSFMLGTGAEVPQVVALLNSMLAPRGERCNLTEVLAELDRIRQTPLPSEPRPIVTGDFLGIGTVITAAMLMKRLRKTNITKRTSSVFSKKSKLQADFRINCNQGRRFSMHDHYCHARLDWYLSPGAKAWRLMGIFDGHGGSDCAKFVANFLPHEVRRMFRSDEGRREAAGDSEPRGPDDLETLKLAAQYLQSALESLDQLFVKFKEHKGHASNLTGTTATVALLAPTGRSAVLCNIGDSRTGLAGDWEVEHYDGYAPEVSPGLIMTYQHTPSDPLEIERIERAGGFVEYGGRGHRVNGVLGVARAIGYAGVPEFAQEVPAAADTLIVSRRGSGRALVALTTDGLLHSKSDAAAFFKRIATADSGAALGAALQEELERAGGDDNDDNATIFGCLLPAETTQA